MGSGKPTSFDIAYHAGVSQATVSRALRNSPLVNEETRKKVQAVARKLNYQVDQHAAALRSQRSRTIALLLFEDPTTDDSQINPFFLAMLGHITRVAAARRYDVLVSFQQLSDDWLNEYQVSNRADGMILLGYGNYARNAERLQKLKEDGALFTIWGATLPELEGHAVGCDNYEGGLAATRHLLALGRRRIAFIGCVDEGCPEFRLRYQGYCNALQEAGLEVDPALRLDAQNKENYGTQAARTLPGRGQDVDGIFAASDLIAFGAMKYLRRNRIRVPQDISIVGFDDVPAASYFSPSLTSVRQDTRKAAEMLVGNLLAMIGGKPVTSSLLPMSLVVRGSCGGRRTDQAACGPPRS